MLRCFLVIGFVAGSLAVAGLWPGRPAVEAAPLQQATPEGPTVEAFQDVNVRAGPGTYYDLVGAMIPGQSAPIVGQAVVGAQTWYKIVYIGGPDNTGWVLGGLVRVFGEASTVPFLTPPPTPTLRPTPTPDVALPEFTATPDAHATRLPTFTPPPGVVRPTLLPVQGVREAGGVPPALIIISLFVLGSFGGLVSLLRRRV